MSVLVDGNHNEVLVEEVHLLGPLPHPVIPLLSRAQVRVILGSLLTLIRKAAKKGGGGAEGLPLRKELFLQAGLFF